MSTGQSHSAAPRPLFETLEVRRLLSANLVESEPNGSRAQADVIPRWPGEHVTVRGSLDNIDGHDFFKLKLKAGDVVGIALTGGKPNSGGLDPYARLLDSRGNRLIENSGPRFDAGFTLPPESPLPRADHSSLLVEMYRVIPRAGTYYVDVSSYNGESRGQYRMDLKVMRPGMESAPRGTKQILYLDFDGGQVNFADFREPDLGSRRVFPLADALPGLGISPAGESALIDGILSHVRRKLSTDLASKTVNDNFGLIIRNSRDNPDPGNAPYVSRIMVGPIKDSQIINRFLGIAEGIDVGNFKTDDRALVFTDYLELGLAGPVRIDPSATVTEFAAAALADVISHEAGHLFGSPHTYQPPEGFGDKPSLMDPTLGIAIGQDLIFGNADDIDLRLIVDDYAADEWFQGVNDTVNTVAFGLSKGRNDKPPLISISDGVGSTLEGDSGQRAITFIVRLSKPSTTVVEVNFATKNGTAGASDYRSASGTLRFASGETKRIVTVQVKGDTTVEQDETFVVKLTGARNAVIDRLQGVGTILNDD